MEVRNVIDIEIITKVTTHYTESYACPKLDGKIIRDKFPEVVNSSIQYGKGVMSFFVETRGKVW